MRYRILTLILVLFLSLTSSVFADQLFPPMDKDGKAIMSGKCPAGQTLFWAGKGLRCHEIITAIYIPRCPEGKVVIKIKDGKPECIDINPDVNISSCPEGQVLIGIINGQPVCKEGGGGSGGVENFTCPQLGMSVVGFEDGKPVCKKNYLDPVQCPKGTAIFGFGDGGVVICAPIDTSKTTISCASGNSVLVGIKNGAPVCAPWR